MRTPPIVFGRKIAVNGTRFGGALSGTIGNVAGASDRILKVSRAIAGLEGTEQIQAAHLAEDIQYQTMDRGMRCRVESSMPLDRAGGELKW